MPDKKAETPPSVIKKIEQAGNIETAPAPPAAPPIPETRTPQPIDKSQATTIASSSFGQGRGKGKKPEHRLLEQVSKPQSSPAFPLPDRLN